MLDCLRIILMIDKMLILALKFIIVIPDYDAEFYDAFSVIFDIATMPRCYLFYLRRQHYLNFFI